MFDLTGKVALVTGAGQGVGAGIASALLSQGASVAVNDIVAQRAQNIASELRMRHDFADLSAEAIAAPFDITDFEATQQGVSQIASELGAVDILINNAGSAGAHSFELAHFARLDPNYWQRFIDINLMGVLHCTKSVLDSMIERRWGRIITISSGAGQTGLNLGVSVYGAAKGAGISFTRHIAVENARWGVTANTLALGLMSTNTSEEATREMAKGIPVGRLGTPEDIGSACVWLASEESAWVTGQTIGINGGAL